MQSLFHLNQKFLADLTIRMNQWKDEEIETQVCY